MVELAVAAAGRLPICRPLTAELVPSGMWWLNLRSILRPGEWDALRARCTGAPVTAARSAEVSAGAIRWRPMRCGAGRGAPSGSFASSLCAPAATSSSTLGVLLRPPSPTGAVLGRCGCRRSPPRCSWAACAGSALQASCPRSSPTSIVSATETPAVLNLLVIEDLAMAVYLPIVGAVVAGKSGADTVTTIAIALIAVTLILTVALRWGHHPQPPAVPSRGCERRSQASCCRLSGTNCPPAMPAGESEVWLLDDRRHRLVVASQAEVKRAQSG